MSYDKIYIEQYLEKFVRPKRPDFALALLRVFECLDSCTVPSTPILDSLVEAVSDKQVSVYEVATEFLGMLAEYDPRALLKIQDLAISDKAHIRHNALLCITAKTPSQIALKIISSGLRDKSARVRSKAADWAQRLMLKEVTPDLKIALNAEINQPTAFVMRSALSALI